MRRFGFFVASLFLLMGITGCSDSRKIDRLSVAGEVTVNGEPLDSGQMVIQPVEDTAGPSTGAEIKNGKFIIPQDHGPVAGKHRIQITAMRSTGKKIKSVSEEDGKVVEVDEIEQYIPKEYNEQSQIVEEINSGNSKQIKIQISF